ncbi:Pop7 protein [Candida orthopsilosis Co 90-125]|uniref:Pop7 protein n=1 Tax=Candida orthopsilosis (strain 90-125) TaxID=1136231 RepID=H8X7R7_CANO9|nr:Pop7 protein [Candida orthopsilosis Co 90-125]CCG23853.1 Pop7 protein [Candida orthopsilosis Co 90-125]
MVNRIEGKHIKHSPQTRRLTETQYNSKFLVKSSTPFISAIKQISKQLARFSKSQGTQRKFQNDQYKKVKYITVKGMGKTIEKTLKLAMHFQSLGYKVDILTGSVKVLDEFERKAIVHSDDDGDEGIGREDCETEYRKRMVSSVEARIWLHRE